MAGCTRGGFSARLVWWGRADCAMQKTVLACVDSRPSKHFGLPIPLYRCYSVASLGK